MKDGKYKVVKFIHTYSCDGCHLKIAEGTYIEVCGGRAIAANTVRFSSRLLNTVQDCLEKIN